jgi:hypothetical protein
MSPQAQRAVESQSAFGLLLREWRRIEAFFPADAETEEAARKL